MQAPLGVISNPKKCLNLGVAASRGEEGVSQACLEAAWAFPAVVVGSSSSSPSSMVVDASEDLVCDKDARRAALAPLSGSFRCGANSSGSHRLREDPGSDFRRQNKS